MRADDEPPPAAAAAPHNPDAADAVLRLVPDWRSLPTLRRLPSRLDATLRSARDQVGLGCLELRPSGLVVGYSGAHTNGYYFRWGAAGWPWSAWALLLLGGWRRWDRPLPCVIVGEGACTCHVGLPSTQLYY